MTHDYKRHGTTTLFAALDVLTGMVIGQCMPRHRHQEWLKFLNTIDREVPQDLAIHLICDNYATHKHQDVGKWLDKHPRLTPALHPDILILVEPGGTLVPRADRQALRRGAFHSVPDLIASIQEYIDSQNDAPGPICGQRPPNPSSPKSPADASPSKKSANPGHPTSEAGLGPPRWAAGLGGMVAVGCWLRSGPSLPSDDRGAAARLSAGQDRLGRPGWRSWLRW